jgi:hypothetical protein
VERRCVSHVVEQLNKFSEMHIPEAPVVDGTRDAKLDGLIRPKRLQRSKDCVQEERDRVVIAIHVSRVLRVMDSVMCGGLHEATDYFVAPSTHITITNVLKTSPTAVDHVNRHSDKRIDLGCGEPQVALGEGKVDLPACIRAARATEWHLVELDECATDIFEALEKSAAYLTEGGFAQGR